MASHPAKTRLPGLDGMRAVAVMGVIGIHLWSVGAFPFTRFWWDLVRYGGDGVLVFFVLSGFLITWLLLSEEADAGKIHLGSFYLRRALRILPPALAYLLVLRLLGKLGYINVAWGDVARAAFFVRNIYFGPPAETVHYWSLAVEEQFYVFWPLLLLLIPRRARLHTTVLLILAAPVWRYHLLADGPLGFREAWRTDYVYDALLIGCLLALLRQDARAGRVLRASSAGHPAILLISLAAFAASHMPIADTRLGGAICPSFFYAGIAMGINYLLFGGRASVDRFLNWRPVVWVGKLSYSLYLWQQLFCFQEAGFRVFWVKGFPQNVLLSFICAALSFYLIERPFQWLRARL
jgi:peptidoglycan/LPS O-acetylase OafA/YrhL